MESGIMQRPEKGRYQGSQATTRGFGISSIFHGIMDQGSNFFGFRDQNSHYFWDQMSKFWVKVWDQLRKNTSRYDPGIEYYIITKT